MRTLFFLLTLSIFLFAEEAEKNIWDTDNVWIKSYINAKNYKVIINNIVKLESRIKRVQNNPTLSEELHQRLELQKSKLNLYEQNKGFDTLLYPYKIVKPEVNLYEYLTHKGSNELEYKIERYIILKNDFYLALSMLQNDYKKNKNLYVSKKDIAYFEEFKENIDKTYSNLLDAKTDLYESYKEYETHNLLKHITTILVLLLSYLLYKGVYWYTSMKNRFFTGIYVLFIFGFLVVRYIDDLLYFITFLSVAAAALTLAMREVILNLAASIYILFSNVIRIGDRVMVQFETKHTIGDIVDISLMKIKLHEIEDYTNLKEVKNVGRTIYLPNSYIFTKVFYNYSRKKDGFINNLVEFEFSVDSDFDEIEKVTHEVMKELGLSHSISFALNNTKTAVIATISYQTNYQMASKHRGEVSIKLLRTYKNNENIVLKASKAPAKKEEDASE
ncbi:mechanosensitive ion channel domain-containing protein [Sulfurimonas sp. C5]|uniref:mechanosensitive ion channel family protein n=1 Tax=Sulfurimonas sp. C5 TaxID=3036947 RepID=UPI002456AF82|nr:mechanosensitive ion channel domain-containing protein [Sulfurimonas sp. C5]MDH4943745.1 mechanosensitive ion channel [Sulfurimonas sp. C5]